MYKQFEVINKLKELIYPRKCPLCRTILDEKETGVLCEKCEAYVLKEHICLRCGRPYDMGQERCLFCENLELPYIERIIALFPYKEVCREAVLRWKYKGIRKYGKSFASLFVHDIEILEKISVDALIPVPLAPTRLKKRGFNQSLDLANEISNLSGIPVYDCLKRMKNTKPQSQCSREERLKNIVGSIVLKGATMDYPELKQVAIIDDIYTTGATVRECIRVVQKNLRLKNTNIILLIVCIGV
nr:ComF family protein [uncultured Cellulosilyticum sp.]